MPAMFKLREAIVAVHTASSESLTIFTVPRGAIIKVIGNPEKSGLVDVLWNGRRIAVFLQDIESRGEVIEVTGAGTGTRG